MKNVTTPTAVLSTVDKAGRYRRHDRQLGTAQLTRLANFSESMTVQLLAQGIQYADDTGRTTGTVSMALRKATPWQIAQLIATMASEGLSTPSQVPAWLNQNALTVLN
jgi:hypothetical protein